MSTHFLKFFVFSHFLSFLQILNAFANTMSMLGILVYNIKARFGACFVRRCLSGYINLMMFTSLMRQFKVLYTYRTRSFLPTRHLFTAACAVFCFYLSIRYAEGALSNAKSFDRVPFLNYF